MRVGDRTIGSGESVYVIAEIGGNHDGSLDTARHLVQVAATCGADCAKFQVFDEEKLYPGVVTTGTIDWAWLPVLKADCEQAGMEFLCSVFDLDSWRAYLSAGPSAVKIASPEAADDNLLIACSYLPLLVSTGAMDWEMCDHVNEVLYQAEVEYCLLHCVSAYPAELHELNLNVIEAMWNRYLVPVGFSDHSGPDPIAACLAVAKGASVIEKHLTPDRSLPGPDHPFALEPGEFRDMVDSIRATETILGDGVKVVQPSEDATDRR